MEVDKQIRKTEQIGGGGVALLRLQQATECITKSSATAARQQPKARRRDL